MREQHGSKRKHAGICSYWCQLLTTSLFQHEVAWLEDQLAGVNERMRGWRDEEFERERGRKYGVEREMNGRNEIVMEVLYAILGNFLELLEYTL